MYITETCSPAQFAVVKSVVTCMIATVDIKVGTEFCGERIKFVLLDWRPRFGCGESGREISHRLPSQLVEHVKQSMRT